MSQQHYRGVYLAECVGEGTLETLRLMIRLFSELIFHMPPSKTQSNDKAAVPVEFKLRPEAFQFTIASALQSVVLTQLTEIEAGSVE
jgi:hypothetical protein